MKEQTHQIKICMGSSCFSRGNRINAEIVQQMVAEGSVKADLQDAEVSGTLCEGLCKFGPIVVIDGVVYRKVTPTVIQDLLLGEQK